MKPRIVLMTSVPQSFATLLHGQPRFLAREFDVTLVTSPGPEVEQIARDEGVRIVELEMPRRITPIADLGALVKLRALMRDLRPDIVHTYTPKAGLLGMMAARAAGVPRRFHSVVGMPLMEARGAKRALLQATERTTYACATRLFANSHGLARYMASELTRRRIEVLGAGSINGINVERFQDGFTDQEKADLRAKLSISQADRIVVFVGRLVTDKGVTELIEAFDSLSGGATLLLVGDTEPLDPLPTSTSEAIVHHPKIRRVGFAPDVRPYLAIADICVLPSYREGLPNSLLEAGAMGVPIVATDINGCNEIVEHGMNGLLVPPKDAAALRGSIKSLLDDTVLRAKLREAARPRVVERFAQPAFHAALLNTYQEAMASP